MRIWGLFIITVFGGVSAVWADTVVLKSGKVYEGKVIHQTPVFVRMELRDPPQVQEFLFEEVKDVRIDHLGKIILQGKEDAAVVNPPAVSVPLGDEIPDGDLAPAELGGFQEAAPIEFEFRRRPVVKEKIDQSPLEMASQAIPAVDEKSSSVSAGPSSLQWTRNVPAHSRRMTAFFRKYYWAGIVLAIIFWMIFKFRGSRTLVFLGFLWMVYGIYRTLDHLGMLLVTAWTRWDIYAAPILCFFSILEAISLLIPRKIKKDPYLPPSPGSHPPKSRPSAGKKPSPVDPNFHDPGAHRGRI
jgi:hypothetical protein